MGLLNNYLNIDQAPRCLCDIDILIMHREQLRNIIGLKKAERIEKHPDLFYNHSTIQKAHTLGTLGAVAGASTPILGLAMWKGSLIKRFPLLTFATWFAMYGVMNKTIPYGLSLASKDYQVSMYARYIKQLRNVQIKQ